MTTIPPFTGRARELLAHYYEHCPKVKSAIDEYCAGYEFKVMGVIEAGQAELRALLQGHGLGAKVIDNLIRVDLPAFARPNAQILR